MTLMCLDISAYTNSHCSEVAHSSLLKSISVLRAWRAQITHSIAFTSRISLGPHMTQVIDDCIYCFLAMSKADNHLYVYSDDKIQRLESLRNAPANNIIDIHPMTKLAACYTRGMYHVSLRGYTRIAQ